MPWFGMIPPAYQSKPDAEKKLVDFRVEYTDPRAIAAAEAGRVINGANYGHGGNPQIGEHLIRSKVPFTTEAQAKAAQNPAQHRSNPLTDALNAVHTAVTN